MTGTPSPHDPDDAAPGSGVGSVPLGGEQVRRLGAYAVVLHPEPPHDRLLMVRLTDRTPFPGGWSLPGGEVEFGEHPVEAVVRELHEETGLRGEVVELLDVGSQVRDFYDLVPSGRRYQAIRILYRVVVAAAGPLVVHDTDGSSDSPTWVPVGEIAGLAVTPAVELALPHLPSEPPLSPTE